MLHIRAARFRAVSFPFFLILLCVLIIAGCSSGGDRQAMQPQEVRIITVSTQTVPAAFPFSGQTESSHQVEIVARVSGFLEKITYREGDIVKAGQVLFVMDQKPFLAQVAAAKGTVENRKAQLWTAKANYDRIKPLADLDAASKSDLDNATGQYHSAQASLYEAEAQLEKAKLDLSYATIRSPITGVTGKSALREGAYLTVVGQSSQLTYVARLDPIWVTFNVSQNDQYNFERETRAGRLAPAKNHQYEVEVELGDGSRYPHIGKVNFADPSYSKDTGSFQIRAALANPRGVLRPGMFVKVYLRGALRLNAAVVPQKAVQQSANGHVVFVVNDQGLVETRPVKAGEWIGQDWLIQEGLKAGDRVIVSGFQKLVPGMPVKPVAAAAPAESLAPAAEKQASTPGAPGK
jgi:membrane fusion protein (multidrug efflux system)